MRCALQRDVLFIPRTTLLAAVVTLAASGCLAGRPALRAEPGAGNDAGTPDAQEAAGEGGAPASHVIRVTTTEVNDVDDGLCSLLEAIAAVNTHAAVNTDDCPAGSGGDVIELPPGRYRAAVVLEPAESMEIRGAGMGSSIISSSGNPLGCAVHLSAEGKTVKLTGLTLTHALPADAPDALTGACVTAGTLWIRHVEVSGFSAGGLLSEPVGGVQAKIEVHNSLIAGNHNAKDGGGIAFVGAGSWITTNQSAIVNNVSEGKGGGIFGASGGYSNYIVTTTISGNVARFGGGVASRIEDQGYIALYWSTVARNRALETGGGMYVESPDGITGHTIVVGDLIAENLADADAAQANLNADWGSNFACTFSLFPVSRLAQQPGNFLDSCLYDVADAKLGPLMDMGGVNHLPIHPLLPGSPAIDAIDVANSYEVAEQRDSWNTAAGDPPLGTEAGDTPAWTTFGRIFGGNPLQDMGAFEFNPRWETELLAVADASAPHAPATTPAGYNHGAGTTLAAGAVGDYVTYQLPIPEGGAYAVAVRTRIAGDAARFQLSVAGAAGGPFVPVGAVQDGFSDSDGWWTFDLGIINVSAAGQGFFKLSVTGKNAASAGYHLYPDYIELVKQ